MGIEETFIEMENVSFVIKGAEIIKSISLKIKKGEIVTLFGPSGCGKSTILKMVLNVVRLQSGKIDIQGNKHFYYLLPIAYLPQDNQLLPWLNIQKNISLWSDESSLRFKDVPNNRDVNEYIEAVELCKHCEKYPNELSGGMARRAALARCLATRSELMLMDEPLISIENRLRNSLMVRIRQHILKNNMTAIIVSHDFLEATFLSDRIVFLSAQPAMITGELKIELPQNRLISLIDTKQFREQIVKGI